MIIENGKRILSLRIRKILLGILTVSIVGFFLIKELKFLEGSILGLTANEWAAIAGGIYLIYFLAMLYLEPYYIYFNDDSNMIITRFYATSIFRSVKQAIEIPKSEFMYYTIKTDFTGFKTKITYYRKTAHGVAKYPTICLSFLDRAEIKGITEALNRYRLVK